MNNVHISRLRRAWSWHILAKGCDDNKVDTAHSKVSDILLDQGIIGTFTGSRAEQLPVQMTLLRLPHLNEIKTVSVEYQESELRCAHPYRHASISCSIHHFRLVQRGRTRRNIHTSPGFKLIPPESKVMPFPTKARGRADASGAPL